MTSSCRSRSPRSCSIAPPQDAAGREQLRVAASTSARAMRFTSVVVCTCLMAPHQLSSLPRTARCSASLACVAAHPEHTCGALTAPFLPLSCRLMHEQRLLTSSYAAAAGEAAACSMKGHFRLARTSSTACSTEAVAALRQQLGRPGRHRQPLCGWKRPRQPQWRLVSHRFAVVGPSRPS